jgi:hypothetical protein
MNLESIPLCAPVVVLRFCGLERERDASAT